MVHAELLRVSNHVQVSTHFDVELPATVTFDYPTIAALAAFIVSKASSATSLVHPSTQLLSKSSILPSSSSTDLVGMSSALATSPIGDQGVHLQLGHRHLYFTMPFMDRWV